MMCSFYDTVWWIKAEKMEVEKIFNISIVFIVI